MNDQLANYKNQNGQRIVNFPQTSNEYIKDIERGFLSLILRNQAQATDYATSQILWQDKRHSLIWQSILELALDKKNPNEVMLASKLAQKGQLEKAGGMIYLCDIYEFSRLNDKIIDYWQALKSFELRQKFTNFLEYNLAQASRGIKISKDNVRLWLDNFWQEFETIDSENNSNSNLFGEKLKTSLKSLKDKLNVPPQVRSQTFFVSTGFLSIDDRISGLEKGKLSILGAKPGVGKTTFSLNLSLNYAKSGGGVIFASFEQSFNSLSYKLLAMEGGVPASFIKNLDISEKQWHKILEAGQSLSKLKLYICDEISNLDQLLATTHRLKLRHPAINLLVVDYLSLILVPQKANKLEQINHIAVCLKHLARSLNISVLAISGLKKDILGNNLAPNIGQCEYLSPHHGDLYLMLWEDKPFYNSKNSIIHFSIPKNKEGQIIQGKLLFNKIYQSFLDYTGP